MVSIALCYAIFLSLLNQVLQLVHLLVITLRYLGHLHLESQVPLRYQSRGALVYCLNDTDIKINLKISGLLNFVIQNLDRLQNSFVVIDMVY
jgi:hypothetical protein